MTEPSGPDEPPKLVGALAGGIAVLRWLARSRSPAGVTRIARETGLNASTCFNLLRTLVHEGLVAFDDATKTYTIGLGLVELARGALERGSFVRLLGPRLDALAQAHAVTVLTWQRTSDERMVLVHVAEHDATVRVQMSVGTRLPLYVGASGRCMAAFGGIDRSRMRARFAALRWDRAPEFDAYWDSVLRTRERGWAIDDGDFQRGTTILAAPVLDRDRRPVMAIGCVAFGGQLDDTLRDALAAELVSLAARATAALSGPPDDAGTVAGAGR